MSISDLCAKKIETCILIKKIFCDFYICFDLVFGDCQAFFLDMGIKDK